MIVGRWMTRDVATIKPHTRISDAAALMAEKKIGTAPVVRDSRLVGLITESDIFRVFVSLFTTPPGGAYITFEPGTLHHHPSLLLLREDAVPRKRRHGHLYIQEWQRLEDR